MTKVTGGQAVVQCLEMHGVRHIFGIPGDVTVPIYEALSQSTINHITTRHEQGAGFMADGYARASRHPGIAVVISGPGVTNISTAMGEAYTDSVPLLVFSADVSTTDFGECADFNHEIRDQQSLAAEICAYSVRIKSIQDIPIAINNAFEYFRTSWPQTIHIGIPTNILEESDVLEIPIPKKLKRVIPNYKTIEQAATILRSANSPIILLGGGSHRGRAMTPILAERLGSPVITTMNGKDSFPNDHPLYAGSGLHFRTVIDALNESDVILAIGTQFGRSDFAPVSASNALPQHARGEKILIRIDLTPSQLNINIPATIEILGDSLLSINSLNNALGVTEKATSIDRALLTKKKIGKEARKIGEKYKPWLAEIRKNISNNGIIAIDSTLVAYLGFPFIDIPMEGSWLYPSAFGTLGYALPAAIGAKFSQPHRPAISIIGDGGFLFTCTELLTGAENNINLPVVVWNDRGFGTIRLGMAARGISPLGVDFTIPDLASLAHGLGCRYENPKTPTQLGSCIKVALEQNTPTVIEIVDGH